MCPSSQRLVTSVGCFSNCTGDNTGVVVVEKVVGRFTFKDVEVDESGRGIAIVNNDVWIKESQE